MRELDLGEIPFYYNLQTSCHNPDEIPDVCSFVLNQDENGVLVQRYSERTDLYLRQAYKKGSNISGLMDTEEIGSKYAEDFLAYILEVVGDVKSKQILEIGCGTGYLLYLLQQRGAIVEGVEPGEYSCIGRKKYSLNIKQKFFDVNDYDKKYDIVVFYGVLEHINNYIKFLKDVRNILRPSGRVILSVPDCEEYIKAGDISLFLHEHWNYFTSSTLGGVISSLGMKYSVRKAGYGGAIYAECGVQDVESLNHGFERCFDDFDMFHISLKRMGQFFLANKEFSIGVYCPVRIINYYKLLDLDETYKIRFFDDDERFHGLFFPGIDISIENYADLQRKPVDIMLIASLTFAKTIKDKVNAAGIKRCITLRDILYETSSII